MGGAERITIDIANIMVNKGHEVAIVYLNGENEHKNIDKSIRLVALDMKKNPLGLIEALCKASKFIKQWQPDIVHAQMFHANIFARILKLMVKKPKLICTEHNKFIGGKSRMMAYRITDSLSDLDTNVSKEALDFFIESKSFNKKKSIVMYNGIDLKRFKRDESIKRNNSCFTFINVGRLTEAKDQANLIDAFKDLYMKHNDVKLIIVGEGEERANLTRRIQEYNLENVVSMPGVKTNIQDYYNMADCFVLSSAWEGFGIVVAEAMACELPVVVTDAGGCAEVVDDKNYVVPVKDSKALSGKMEEIYLLSGNERSAIGKRNHEAAKRFDIQYISEEWNKIYSKIK